MPFLLVYIHRTLLIALLIIAGCACLSGQYFERYLDLGGDEILTEAAFTRDGNIALAGNTDVGRNGLPGAMAMILDLRGEPVRTVVSDNPESNTATGVSPHGTGGMYLTTEEILSSEDPDPAIYGINGDGRLSSVHSWRSATGDERLQAVLETDDGDLLATGSVDDKGALARLKPDGSEEFRFLYSSGAEDIRGVFFTSIAEAGDGNYILGGYMNVALSSTQITVVKVRPDGEMLWRKDYAFPDLDQSSSHLQSDMTVDSGGNIWITRTYDQERGAVPRASVGVIKLDPQGEKIFASAYDSGSTERGWQNIVALSDGSAIVSATQRSLDSDLLPRGQLLHLSPTGAILRHKVFVNGGGWHFLDVLERPDGAGFLVTGYGKRCVGSDYDLLLLSLDREFNYVNDGCREVESPPAQRINFELTPLPAGPVEPFVVSTLPADGIVSMEANFHDRLCQRITRVEDPPAVVDCLDSTGATPIFAGLEVFNPQQVIDRLTLTITGGPDGQLLLDQVPGITLAGGGTEEITLNNPGRLPLSALIERVLAARLRPATTAAGQLSYQVRLVLDIECNQTWEAEANLIVSPSVTLPPTGLADTVLCSGATILLGEDPATGVTYSWGGGQTTASIGVETPGTYTLVRDNGCRRDTQRVVVSALQDPPLTDARERFTICPEDSIAFTPAESANTTYIWDDGLLGSNRVFREAGTFLLSREDACGTATTTVEVSLVSCCQVFLPSAFSPDGDGRNDTFRPYPGSEGCADTGAFLLTVYDRWGSQLYAGSDAGGWDGRTPGGRPAGSGSYLYVLTYFDGVVQRREAGTVMLVDR